MSFQTIGTIVGQILYGPQGAVIGSFIGQQIDYAVDDPIQGPRLQDRTVQISGYGAAIPLVFGSWRLAGNVIWPRDFQVTEHSETESAKGGPEMQTYSYSATFAVLLCQGPIEGIGRIWMNKRLVHDPNAFPTTDPCISIMRVYLGAETQDPDPLMVAADGDAPAYRGWAYIMFEALELTQSGFANRPPSVEVEVFTEAAVVPPPTPRVVTLGVSETVPTNTAAIATVDPDTKWVWTVRDGFLVDDLHVTVVSDVGEQVIASFTQTEASAGGFSPASVCATPVEVWVLVNTWPFPDRHAYIARFTKGAAASDGSAAIAPTFIGWFRVADGPIDSHAMAYEPIKSKIWITYSFTNATATSIAVVDPLTRLTEYQSATGVIIGNPFRVCPGNPYVGVLGSLGGGNPEFLIFDSNTYALLHTITLPSNYLQGKALDYDSKRKAFIVLAQTGRTYYSIDAASGSITTHSFVESADHDTTPPINTSGVTGITYFAPSDKYIVGTNSTATLGSTLYIINAGSHVVEKTYTYETGANNLLINPLLAPATNGNYLLGFDLTHVKRLYIGGGILGGPVTLGSIVSKLSTGEPYGLDASDIDVTQLTDLVDGYMVGQAMPRRSAIEPLMAAYFFDGVESDHKLKYIKRGAAPAVTIAFEDRAAHTGGRESMPAHLSIQRTGELEVPWQYDVVYTDKARDYQPGMQYDRRIVRNANDPQRIDLPILLTGEKAKQVAIVNLYQAWLRTGFTFATTLKYAKYEPTDIVVLPTEEVDYIGRIVKRNDQGNGIIEWEAKIEDVASYSQSGIVSTSNFVPQSIRNPGETVLELLDTPLLRDTDDNAGFYVAMAGTTDGWPGAQLLRSSDAGSTYAAMLSATQESAIGRALSVLGDFSAGNIFDNGNSVTVRLDSGGPLVSATETQVLNGSNAAVLGVDGRWEVLQFKTATLLAPDTYQLSGFLRGRRGTEWTTGLHATGDTFVLASLTAWRRPNPGSADIGLERLYKAPPFATQLGAAAAESFINFGTGLKPYAPVDLAGTRDGSNNLTITWRRRSRIGYGPLNAIVPLGEATEEYSLELYDGATLLRSASLSAPTYIYSAADQTTDGITPGDPVRAVIAQDSAVVGLGYLLEGTV
jgi:hypothetical protein